MVVMEEARGWLRTATRIAALTGAGVSAESGIPTFRGPGGLWRTFQPEDLATPRAFARDPKLVWEWYDWRRQLIARAEPNAAHHALAELESRRPGFQLITQNVDGLHHRAGSARVVTLHGDIWIVRCLACGVSCRDERVPLPELPPRCSCGGMLRPGVVWFGESLPSGEWAAAEEAASRCDVFLVVGTAAAVMPAGGLALRAQRCGARVIEVNPAGTQLSAIVDCSLRGPAGEILPALLEELR